MYYLLLLWVVYLRTRNGAFVSVVVIPVAEEMKVTAKNRIAARQTDISTTGETSECHLGLLLDG